MAAGRSLPLGPFGPDGLLATPTRHDTSHPFKHRAVDWSEEERAIELPREIFLRIGAAVDERPAHR